MSARVRKWAAGAAVAAALALVAPQPQAQSVNTSELRVTLNHAQVLNLEGTAATALVADPDVADIVNERGNLLFVLGKRIGTTNLLVYDAEGHALANRELVVVPDTANVVTVTRDIYANDYYCTPRCVSPPAPSGGSSTASSGPPPGANAAGSPPFNAPTQPAAPAAPATAGAPIP
jgi:hypothetical protein